MFHMKGTHFSCKGCYYTPKKLTTTKFGANQSEVVPPMAHSLVRGGVDRRETAPKPTTTNYCGRLTDLSLAAVILLACCDQKAEIITITKPIISPSLFPRPFVLCQRLFSNKYSFFLLLLYLVVVFLGFRLINKYNINTI